VTHFCITHNKYSFEVLSSRNFKLLDPSRLSSIIVLFIIILDTSQPFVNWDRKNNDQARLVLLGFIGLMTANNTPLKYRRTLVS
jgi:hypothetical protein